MIAAAVAQLLTLLLSQGEAILATIGREYPSQTIG